MAREEGKMQRGHALYDFHANEDDEVSIKANESFFLLETYDDDWWLVNVSGRVGVVPSNYVQLDNISSPLRKSSNGGQQEILPRSHSKNAMSPLKVNTSLNHKDLFLSPHETESPHPLDSAAAHFAELALTPNKPQQHPHNQPDAFYQSTELKRLKSLREQAEVKIETIRNAVSNFESQGPPTFSSTNQAKNGRTSSQLSPNGPDQVSTSVNSSGKKPQLNNSPGKGVRSSSGMHKNNNRNGIAGYGDDDIDDNDSLAGNDIRPTVPPGKPNGKTSASLDIRRSSSARRLSNSNSATGIQQVTLDPSSIEYISRIINEKLEREFKSRDQRLMNQVQELVNQSLLQFQNQMLLNSPKGMPQLQAPLSLPSQISHHHHGGHKGIAKVRSGDEYSDVSMDSMVGHELSRKPSSSNRAIQNSKYTVDRDNTKIPRIKLPKVNNYTDKKANGNGPTSSRSSRSISTEGQGGGPAGALLPPIIPKTKQPIVNNIKPVKEELLSMDGVQYPHCRSVVYPSTQDITLLRNRHIQQQQQAGPAVLTLKHIFGYDGDANRHGGATKGKNVLWLRVKHQNKVAYPAASVVIVTDVTTNQQSFFTGHSDDVTCLCQHPTLPIIASSQLGSEGVILVWSYDKLLQLHQQYGHSTMEKATDYPELSIASSVRGISGVDFSGDGKLLLACSMEEIRSVYIFDWEKGVQLCSAKVGHIEVCQFKFNPYCYMPFDHDSETSSGSSVASGANGSAKNNGNKGIQPPNGCYTLTSFGGKQVKFWTIKAQFQSPSNIPVPNGGGGGDGAGARDYRGKQFRAKTIKYILEGTQGTSTRKAQNQVDYTACTFVGEYGEFETNKVLLGTSSGAIHIWQHLLEKGDHPNDLQGVMSWLSRGKLLAVITDAHESPIVDFDYFPGRLQPQQQQKKGKGRDRESGSKVGEKLISTDQTGIVNIWGIDRNQQQVPQQQVEVLPLQHLGGMQLDESFARSVTLNNSHVSTGTDTENGEQAVLGLANNSILLLQLNGLNVGNANENNESPVFDMQRIVNCHNGKVKRLAVNPLVESIFASICSDRTIHLWDTDSYTNIGTIDLEVSATAISFSSNGVNVAVGNEKGELLVLHSVQFQQFLNEKLSSLPVKKQKRSTKPQTNVLIPEPCVDWQLVDSKVVAQGNASAGNKNAKKLEITEIKYSPVRDLIAVGCKDTFIHLLVTHSATPGSGLKHVGVCKGHTSYIKNIDFSSDGRLLKTTDAAKELLFWDVESAQRLTNANAYREAQWQTNSCVYGWGLQGVFNRWDAEKAMPPDNEINCVCRSIDGNLVAASGSHTVRSAIKLFTYPCLPDSVPFSYGGHTSPVLDLQFVRSNISFKGMNLVSAGGNDSSIFVWDVVTETK